MRLPRRVRTSQVVVMVITSKVSKGFEDSGCVTVSHMAAPSHESAGFAVESFKIQRVGYVYLCQRYFDTETAKMYDEGITRSFNI